MKVTGTIGILLKAKNQNIIRKLKPLLNELTTKGVWISEKLIEAIVKQVGER